MDIFLIKAKGDNVGQSNTYESHVIVAKHVETVVELARDHALDEGLSAWVAEEVERLGTYTGTHPDPYIVQSHLVYFS